MRRTLPLFLIALACSEPTPEPMPGPIALAPDTRIFMLGSHMLRWGDRWMDSVTNVANMFYYGSRYPGDPHGPDLYVSFYFAGIWKEGQVTLDDFEKTLLANYDDSVLVAIKAPPNDPGARYYVLAMPSTGPRTHHRALMRVGADGPDLFNFVLRVSYWGDPTERNPLHDAWVRDSSRFWAEEVGRLKLARGWRERFLTVDEME